MNVMYERGNVRRIATTVAGVVGGISLFAGCSSTPEAAPSLGKEKTPYELNVDVNITVQENDSVPETPAPTTESFPVPTPPEPVEPNEPTLPSNTSPSPTIAGSTSTTEYILPTDPVKEEPPYAGPLVESPDLIIGVKDCIETHDNPNPFPVDFKILVDLDPQTNQAVYNVTDASDAVVDGGARIFTDREDALAFFCSPFGSDTSEIPLDQPATTPGNTDLA